MRKSVIGYACTSFLVIVFTTLGFLGQFFMPGYVQSQVEAAVKLTSPESTLFNTWQNPGKQGNDIYQAIYIFNLTNAPQVAENGETPQFERIGPYMYLEHRIKPKDSIGWFVNGSVQYGYRTTYEFVPSLSIYKGRQLSEDDNITHVNIAVFGVAQQAQGAGTNAPAVWEAMSFFMDLEKTPIFLTHSAKNLTWGYTDPLLSTLKILQPTLSPLVQLFNPDDPTSYQMPSECYTGGGPGHLPNRSIEDSVQSMTMWIGMRSLPYYFDDQGNLDLYANMINGTDATQFHPNVKNTDTLYAFVDSIYRSGYMTYLEDVVLHGVTLKRFVLAEEMLQPYTQNPDNKPFQIKNRAIMPLPNLPIFITKAMFLDADMSVINVTIDNHNPPSQERERDDVFIDVEPMSGAVFSAQKRLQLNVYLTPLRWKNASGVDQVISVTANLPTTYFPIVHVNEYGIASEKVCNDFISSVYTPLRVGKYGGVGSFVVAALLVVAMGITSFRSRDLTATHEEKDPINFNSYT